MYIKHTKIFHIYIIILYNTVLYLLIIHETSCSFLEKVLAVSGSYLVQNPDTFDKNDAFKLKHKSKLVLHCFLTEKQSCVTDDPLARVLLAGGETDRPLLYPSRHFHRILCYKTNLLAGVNI